MIHLLAELVENATLFSAPHTQVLLRAQHVTAGLAVEVEDRGLGMPAGELEKMNALLTDPDQVNVAHLLQDGRIGLFVVSALARRHGIAVRLQSNIYGECRPSSSCRRACSAPTPADPPGSGPHDARRRPVQARPADGTDPRPGTHAPAHPPAPRPDAHEPAHPAAPAHEPALPTAPAHEPPRPAAPAHRLAPRADAHDPAHPALPAQREQDRAVPALAPLPVRGDRNDRPNPAAARPGRTHRTPPAPALHDAPPPPPGAEGEPPPATPVRGTTGRPQLPRRRSQEHLVPQLREAPHRARTRNPNCTTPA
ncbi:ATP-binding protein [Streptomyces zhihengii]